MSKFNDKISIRNVFNVIFEIWRYKNIFFAYRNESGTFYTKIAQNCDFLTRYSPKDQVHIKMQRNKMVQKCFDDNNS
jgi:hypothetical protein